MQHVTQSSYLSKSEFLDSACIKTTLYDLIEAVNETVKPSEDRWVPLIVADILRYGRSIAPIN